MIHTGRIQELEVLRSTSVGLYLGDGGGNEVLLPNKYVPPMHDQGIRLRVFVYRDSEDRQVATTLMPKVELGGFAWLKVSAATRLGAFVDIGLEKDLLVPFSEQEQKLGPEEWHVVHMGLDGKTDRLFGSTRIAKYLDNTDLAVGPGEAVDLLVYRRSELGWSVVVNGRHQGLLHANEVYRPVNLGDRITGHVKHVRPDGKLDITLQAPGYRHYNDANAALLAKRLKEHDGFLPLTDKSPPEQIYQAFGISKKAFKQALGALYKARLVLIKEEGITWTGGDQPREQGQS